MPTQAWGVTDRAGNTVTRSVTYDIGGTSVGPLVGVNTQSPEPSYSTSWPVARVYRLGHAATAAASFGSKIVAVTDDPNVSLTGGAASATKLRNALEAFYYTGSGAAARKDVEYHWANNNEVDREWQSGSIPAAYVDTCRLMHAVIHETDASGVRRYPKASMWCDLTTWQVKTANVAQRYRAIAPYLDGIAASLYPTGREVPVVFTPYPDYIDPVLALAVDWGIADFACWEVGIPIDRAHNDGTPNNGGTTNWSIRPRYLTGGRDSTGKTWEGFLNYLHRRCRESGLNLRDVIYWNEQVNPAIPNPFKHDRLRTTPDTATAWRAWAPGSTLPNA